MTEKMDSVQDNETAKQLLTTERYNRLVCGASPSKHGLVSQLYFHDCFCPIPRVKLGRKFFLFLFFIIIPIE